MKYSLLIVDDELSNLRLLEKLFAPEYECLTASSGAEAIGLLEQHEVAITITDQRMQGMTGIDLLKLASQSHPHMVGIILTAYADVEVLIEAVNSGLVHRYVTKPWNSDDLKLKIRRACEHYESNKKLTSLLSANDRLLQILHRSGQQFDPEVMAIMSHLNPDDLDNSETFAAGEHGGVGHSSFEPAFVDATVW